MLATGNFKRMAALALFLSFCSTSPARSQTAPRQNIAELAPRVPPNGWAAHCHSDLSQTRVFAWRAPDLEPGVFPIWPEDDSRSLDVSGTRENCADTRMASMSVINRAMQIETPCMNSPLRTAPCAPADDSVAVQLDSLGRAGAGIRRARNGVLDILSSQNACSEWFATRDAVPHLTFESLGFIMDYEGAEDVLATVSLGSNTLIRQPYVARATQDGGANTDITINTNGAFYRAQAKLQRVSIEGGPLQFSGEYWLTVGSYSGNTLPAQMLTLLHELGHVINLLPEDSDDLDGKSARNTGEVLRHCRAEIESRAKQARETAKK
jgi:hypothetical protein